MTRRWKHHTIWALTILALVVVGWLLVDLTAPAGDAGSSSQDVAVDRRTDLIEGQATHLDEGALAPSTEPGLESQRRMHGPVTLRVVNPWGVPFSDRRVFAVVPSRWVNSIEGEGTTDARGRVFFADLPYDQTCTITVGPDPHLPLGKAVVTGPRLRIELNALPIRVTAQTSDSGRSLRGVAYSVHPKLDEPRGVTGDAREHLVTLGPRKQHGLIIVTCEAPSGYVAWDECRHNLAISPAARRLTYMAPLRPEADVFLTLPEARRDWRFNVKVHGKRVAAEVISDAFGRTRVRGVPFVPGAAITVVASGEEIKASGSSHFGVDPRDAVTVELRAPKKPTKKRESVMIAPGRVSIHIENAQWKTVVWSINGVPASATNLPTGVRQAITSSDPKLLKALLSTRYEILTTASKPKVGRSVELRILDPLGRPAHGARVKLAAQTLVTDAQGRVVFGNVPARKQKLTVLGAGPSWHTKVDVTAGPYQKHAVRVPAAGAIVVEVVGKDGRQLPHARVSVKQGSKLPWYDMDDGVQRLDPFTDHRGTRRLLNIQPDTDLVIEATYAGQTRLATARLAPGELKTVRIDMSKPQSKLNVSKSQGSVQRENIYRVLLGTMKERVLDVKPK